MDNLQFQTPPHLCEWIVGRYAPKISTSTVLEPTPGTGNFVAALRKSGLIYIDAPQDFFALTNSRYDAIIGNPPFTPMKLGYEILFKCMGMSDNITLVMPWLTLINGERRLQKLRDFGLREIIHLPRSIFPGSRVQTCVINLKRSYSGSPLLDFYKAPK